MPGPPSLWIFLDQSKVNDYSAKLSPQDLACLNLTAFGFDGDLDPPASNQLPDVFKHCLVYGRPMLARISAAVLEFDLNRCAPSLPLFTNDCF